MVRAGPWVAMDPVLGLLLLVLMMATQQNDWMGSFYGEWNTIPNKNWFQYRCRIPRCPNFFQCPDKATLPVICEPHDAVMRLDHDPTRG